MSICSSASPSETADGDRFGKGVQIGGNDIDWDDLVRFERAHVRRVVAASQ